MNLENIRPASFPKCVGAICLACVLSGCAPKAMSFVCDGDYGTSQGEEQIPFLDRTITGNSAPIQGSVVVNEAEIALESFGALVDGKYEICDEGEATIGFAPAGHSDPHCVLSSTKIGDYGVFNKITGQLRYHVGSMLVVLRCRKSGTIAN